MHVEEDIYMRPIIPYQSWMTCMYDDVWMCIMMDGVKNDDDWDEGWCWNWWDLNDNVRGRACGFGLILVTPMLSDSVSFLSFYTSTDERTELDKYYVLILLPTCLTKGILVHSHFILFYFRKNEINNQN